jgi:hypothetical protein
MKLFLFVIIFLLIFVAAIVLLLLNYLRKGIRHFQKVVTGDYDDEETFRRMSEKHYRAKTGSPNFDKDYFKSKSAGTDGTNERSSQEQATRRTTTQEGVTIIDDRTNNKKKIFDDNEGEYVEFEEVG